MGKNKNKNKKNYQAKQSQNNTLLASQSFTVLNNPAPNLPNQQPTVIEKSSILKHIVSSDSDSDIQVSDFEDDLHKQKVDFNIKQWFHLGLSKFIPPSDKSIIIDLIKNEVSGEKAKVDKFCEKTKNQISSMVIKIIKLKIEISPDTIMFEMDQDWKCQIFTVELLRKVWDKIQKSYKVTQEMAAQIEGILNKDGVTKATRFLWVLKSVQEEAVDVVKKVHKEKKEEQSNSLIGQTTIIMSAFEEKPPKREQKAPKREQKPQRREQKPPRSELTITESKFVEGLRSHKKQEESPKKKLFDDDDSDEFDFTELTINANSKNPRKQEQIKNVKAEQSKKKTESFLKLLNDDNDANNSRQNSIDSVNKVRTPRVQRGNRRPPQRATVFIGEYPEQYLDKNHLKKWIKGNRSLNPKDLEINQKFSEQDNKMYIEVVFCGEQIHKEKQYAINMYFKHDKVIKLDPEDADLRQKLIQNFVSEDKWLKIQHKKIYTQQRHPSFDVLKDFCRSDNSAKSMHKTHTNLTHVLYIVGIITLVRDMEGDVEAYIKQLQNTCRRVEITLTFDDISEFMRNKRLQDFINGCIKECLKQQPEKYTLIHIKNVFANVLVEIEMFKVPDKDLKSAENYIKQKLHGLIDQYELPAEESKTVSKMLDKLSETFLLFENSKKTITLISKAKEIKEKMAELNKGMKSYLQNVMKEHIVKQKSQFALSKDFLQKKNKQNPNSNIKIRFQDGNPLKIVFFGPEIVVNDFLAKLEEFLENLEDKIREYNMSLTDEQLDIIEKDKEIHKHIEDNWKITIKCDRNYTIGAVIDLKPQNSLNSGITEKTIVFEKQFNFESLQENSIFFFRDRKDLDYVKQSFILPFKALINNKKSSPDAINEYDKQKKCHYLFKEDATVTQIIEESKKCNPQVLEVCMYLSQSILNFDVYLKNLIKIISSDKDLAKTPLQITVVYKKSQDLKKILNLKEGKQAVSITRKWYTIDGGNKLFYSQQGNKKIEDSVQSGLNIVELTNSDIDLTIQTHQFDFDNKTMTHLQSGNQFPIEIHPSKVTVKVNGVDKTIPDSQYQKIPNSGFFWGPKKLTNCKLSIGFYQISIKEKMQKNLFSNFQRKIAYEETQSEKFSNDYDLVVNYEIKTNKLVLEYSEENQKFLKPTISHIQTYLDKKLIEVTKPFDKEFTLELIGQFQDEGNEQNIQVLQSQDGKSAIFRAYNEKNIENFVKMLTHLGKAKINKTISVQYPKEWQAQTQDIQTFLIVKNTPEFNLVQNVFTAGTIVELIRIQNKSVYKKFTEEKAFLRQLNEGKPVKEMLLYHGTSQTDPKVIYEDKEDCFNINYTGQSNLLGRGTYFAERSEYSVSYSYQQNTLVGKVYCMFYCQVLVGESQKCLKHDSKIRDTDFKDPVKRIKYESMTDFLDNSNVFVVYKNRRAYPLYLIKYKR